jgi:hypothetical protein
MFKRFHLILFNLTFLSLVFSNNSSNNDKCVLGICDIKGGKCINGICNCIKGFSTYLTSKNHLLCNYEQKNSVAAGLLELFLGSGTGHFYSGRRINGVVKLSFSVFFYFSCCCSLYLIRKLKEDPRTSGHPHISFLFLFAMIVGITIFFWQIVDSILFIFGLYYDGNNMPLY